MEHGMINVLIADDEQIVREGIKHLIDWNNLGFCICAEAGNGEEALEKIHQYQPDLVFLDIRMPKMYGTEIISRVRKEGFEGQFIILSGYTDFEYAKTALQYGASFYLNKPIDEHELIEAVLEVKQKIERLNNQKISMNQYLRRAKQGVFADLLLGREFHEPVNFLELGLTAPVYQVVLYEGYTPYYQSYNFADMLRVTNRGNNSFESLVIDQRDVILLKGNFALDRFNSCLKYFANGAEKNSPLDTIFLTYGPVVYSLDQVHASYEAALQLMERRFFCRENQHVLSYENLPQFRRDHVLTPEISKEFSGKLIDDISSFKRKRVGEDLQQLADWLYDSGDSVISIKHFLTDIFLQIKQAVLHQFPGANLNFDQNSSIIERVEDSYYLFEILSYFSEQFELIIQVIGNNSSESVFDDIIYYIEHNYQKPLKLETLARLFGYNSSYLGKMFTQKAGKSFNTYLDELRVNEAAKLLMETQLKVYEIAAHVGYKNVDYFHQKFKKSKGVSPAEYRKLPRT